MILVSFNFFLYSVIDSLYIVYNSDLGYKKNISVSILTGDRAITSLAIGKEIKLYEQRKNVREIKCDNIDIIEKYIDWSVNKVTVLLSGIDFNKIKKNKIQFKLLTKIISNPKCNFIAYSLIPSMKLQLTNICKQNNNKIISIGDGYNDIGMIRNSNIGVCVKNKNNQNVMINSDLIVNGFQDLQNVLHFGYNSYSKNTFISLFFFFKSIFVSFSILLYLIINDFNLENLLFDGLTIQILNTIWSCLLITYFGIDFEKNKLEKYSQEKKLNFKLMIKSILIGIFFSILNSYSYYKINKNYSVLLTCSTIDFYIIKTVLNTKKYKPYFILFILNNISIITYLLLLNKIVFNLHSIILLLLNVCFNFMCIQFF